MLGLGLKVSVEADQVGELGFLRSWYGWGRAGGGAKDLVLFKNKKAKQQASVEKNRTCCGAQ